MQIDTHVVITDIPRDIVLGCSMPGEDATSAVEAALSELDISFTDPDRVRRCLKGYGAWDDDDLEDDEKNAKRLFWIMCNDFSEYLSEAKRIKHDPYTEERPESFSPRAGSDIFPIE